MTTKKQRIERLESRVSELEVLLEHLEERQEQKATARIAELNDRIRSQEAILEAQMSSHERREKESAARIAELNDRIRSQETIIGEQRKLIETLKEQATKSADREGRGLTVAQLVDEWINGEEGAHE